MRTVVATEGASFVYRLFGSDDTLLYVGVTGDVARRRSQHAATKPWWGDVATMTVEVFPTREQAADVERAAIHEESPVHNQKQGRPLGELDAAQFRRLDRAAAKRDAGETGYRAAVVAVLAEGAPFAEVSKATGLSTNTLQRWKRDAPAPSPSTRDGSGTA